MIKKSFLILMLFFFFTSPAQARIHILISEASQNKFPIAIPQFMNARGNPTGEGRDFADLLKKDLKISGIFKVLDDSMLPSRDSDVETINFEKWQAIEVGAVVKGFVDKSEGKPVYTLKLYDVGAQKMILGKKYIVDKKNTVDAVHRFVDSLMEALTGTPGPFNSMIAGSCGGNFKKSIGTFNMDSTKRGGMAQGGINRMSPAISPDGSRIAYSAYTRQGFLEIFVDGRQITNFKSTTITPAWTSDGSRLIVASAYKGGDTDLYAIGLNGRVLQQLTSSRNIDFNAAVMGDRIVFSSERTGGLQLFATSTAGGGAAQLTYTGYQNDMPDWSPDGTKITFAGRDEGVFDVFVMQADGSNIQRITRGEGSNESPVWAPDSRYIAFTSTRGGVYVTLEDGTSQTLIEKTGGCKNLDWGPWLTKN